MISDERLAQMSALLAVMSNRNKAPSDGLGIYLGDGIPREKMGDLRSLELRAVIEELIALRAAIREVAKS
jgi:hypothetical protein